AQRRSNPGQATHEPSEHHATTTCHCEERGDEATSVKQPTNSPSTTRPQHVIARSAATKQPRSSNPRTVRAPRDHHMSLRGARRRSNLGQATHEQSEHHATTTCHCEERSDEATSVKQPTNRPSTTRPPHVIARSAATKQPRSSNPRTVRAPRDHHMSLRGARRRSNLGQATHEQSEHHATTTCHCEERSDEATSVKQPTNRPSTTRPPHVIAR